MSKIDYYERQEARRERYIQRAAKARRNAAFAAQKAGEMAAVIPAGQPIHVGHYSEKSDRRYRERIGQTMDKAIGLDDKADYYAEKAKTVGRAAFLPMHRTRSYCLNTSWQNAKPSKPG